MVNKGYERRQWVANDKEQKRNFLRCYRQHAKSLREL